MDQRRPSEKQGRAREAPSPSSESSSERADEQEKKETSRSTMVYREAEIIAENLKESGPRR